MSTATPGTADTHTIAEYLSAAAGITTWARR